MDTQRTPSFSLTALYLLAELPLGILYFTVAVTGISLGIGLSPLVIGLPLLGGVMGLGGRIARLEAQRSRSLLGESDAGPAAADRPYPDGRTGWLASVGRSLSSGDNWKGLILMLMKLPLGITAFVFAVVMLSLTLGFLASPIVYYSIRESLGINIYEENLLSIWAHLSPTETNLIVFALGVLMAAATYKALPAFARGYLQLTLALSR